MEQPPLILIYDTETSAIPEWKLPSEDPAQPHLVEIAGLLFTEAGELVDKFHAYVKPTDWRISDEALAVHGLTHEFLAVNGIAEGDAVRGLMALQDRAVLRVAHNRTFDDRIMRIGIKRFWGDGADITADAFKLMPGACTALLAKPVCKLPATEAMKKTNFKNSFKTPTLAEAYAHLTEGGVLEGAHSAMNDAIACARVYFLLKGITLHPAIDLIEGTRIEGAEQGEASCAE